jgi:hypothetical protein
MARPPCQRGTPDEVVIRREPRPPERDPTLGVPVAVAPGDHVPPNRLVTIGDSLTQGFMSGAVFRTDLAWPAIVAGALGIAGDFRYPVYEQPDGPGGIPLDLERLARQFDARFSGVLDWYEVLRALRFLRSYMDRVEDHWERGPGAQVPAAGPPFHNLGVYGWDLVDALVLDADRTAARLLTRPPSDDFVFQVVERDNDRVALVVLERLRTADGAARTVFDAAAAFGAEGTAGGAGDSPGIETLAVMLGANNALGAIVRLDACWTPDGYGDLPIADRLEAKSGATVWRPSHFADEWARVVEAVRAVRARHVIVATVPAVTIAPLARGVGEKVSAGSRYCPYYTRPWISDDDFDPAIDPHLTADDFRAIDSAIDAYNETIIASVREARLDGLDWHLFELGGLLDSLAVERYAADPSAQPAWWQPYELPEPLQALEPVPNTHFFQSGPDGRTDGGLISLDGVHPTTIGSGLLAQEVIRIMEVAGVAFPGADGGTRDAQLELDFERLLTLDTLVSDPPTSVSSTVATLGWLDQVSDWVRRVLPG